MKRRHIDRKLFLVGFVAEAALYAGMFGFFLVAFWLGNRYGEWLSWLLVGLWFVALVGYSSYLRARKW